MYDEVVPFMNIRENHKFWLKAFKALKSSQRISISAIFKSWFWLQWTKGDMEKMQKNLNRFTLMHLDDDENWAKKFSDMENASFRLFRKTDFIVATCILFILLKKRWKIIENECNISLDEHKRKYKTFSSLGIMQGAQGAPLLVRKVENGGKCNARRYWKIIFNVGKNKLKINVSSFCTHSPSTETQFNSTSTLHPILNDLRDNIRHFPALVRYSVIHSSSTKIQFITLFTESFAPSSSPPVQHTHWRNENETITCLDILPLLCAFVSTCLFSFMLNNSPISFLLFSWLPERLNCVCSISKFLPELISCVLYPSISFISFCSAFQLSSADSAWYWQVHW